MANQSVSQSVSQSTNQPAKQSPTTTQSFSHTHHAMQPRPMYLSHPLGLFCHSAGDSWRPFQSHPTRYVTAHSLTHAARHTHSILRLAVSHATISRVAPPTHPCYSVSHSNSVRCALRPRAILRMLSHAASYLARSHAHGKHLSRAKAKFLLSLSPSHTCRCLGRTEVEDHDL